MGESNGDLVSLFPDLEEFEGQPVDLVSEQVRIEGVELQPEDDGQRVVVGIAITPTRERPNLEIVILSPDDRVVAETCIVEARGARQVLTMHLSPPDPSLTYTVKVGLLLGELLVDAHQTELTWPR
jgi:hypothetical protein